MNDFQFGDVIENGWASDDNPTKRGVFLYYKVRTGRLNPGKHAVLRSDGGSLGEFRIGKDSKLTKVGTIFDSPAEPIDCRSDIGITMGMIDGIIASARVLSQRDLSHQAIQEALKDIRSDEDVLALLAISPAASRSPLS
ncbi:hypothetical protein [Rhizobium azibense]|uniref:Uncharacterized protein n=1 Tax=Rhizobium azibense TaxID=1136135 RepID=A0A4R3RKG6_9HYPH|nr:hypothetical protein [Rhizobium azibense]TCU34122.1 hypothetical protein EV129_113106 [Rhizobium azibense]